MILRYDEALAYATKKHQGQLRIGGEPYITHPVAVANMLEQDGYGEEYVITALFHDLLEDTDATKQEILELGGEAVLEAVVLLTKETGYNMEDYIARIKKNPIAFAVKGRDRLHNLNTAYVADDEFKRQYIAESRQYYLDFLPQIAIAVDELERSLS